MVSEGGRGKGWEGGEGLTGKREERKGGGGEKMVCRRGEDDG